MIIKFIKKLFRLAGVELSRYSPETCDAARLARILTVHQIDLVLDIGANTGQYRTYLREIGYRGKVISYEPLSSAYDQLVSMSKKDPNWIIAPRIAIGDRSGEIILHISGNSESSSVLNMLNAHIRSAPESAYIADQTVPVRRLDEIAREYVANSNAAYLKIDVQGYEPQVIDGAMNILSGIKGIQLELSLIPLYEHQALYRDVINKLDGLGYELHALFPVFSDSQTGRVLQMDGVFIKK